MLIYVKNDLETLEKAKILTVYNKINKIISTKYKIMTRRMRE